MRLGRYFALSGASDRRAQSKRGNSPMGDCGAPMLKLDSGLRVAILDAGGWDT